MREKWMPALLGVVVGLAVTCIVGQAPCAAPIGISLQPTFAEAGDAANRIRAGEPGLRPNPVGFGASASRLEVGDWFGRPPVDRNPRAWQRKKNPTVAMVSSFLVPGLGQLYNERGFWALVAAGVHIYYVGDIIIQSRLTNRFRRRADADPADTDARVLFLLHRDNRTQSAWLLGLTVLLSGLQAFVDAHLSDFEEASLQLEPSLGRVNGGALRLHF